jgi:pilus assembly protein CpaF
MFNDQPLPLIDAFATVAEPSEPVSARDDGRGPGYYELALNRLRDDALERFPAAELQGQSDNTISWCRSHAFEILAQVNDQSLSKTGHRAFDSDERTVDDLLNDLLGLGPLERLMELPDVEDVAINGPDDIWYSAGSAWVKTDIRFQSPDRLQFLLNQAVAHTGRSLSPQTPILDAQLRTGHRINIVTAPIADPWPSAVIRIHRRKRFTIFDLLRGGDEGESRIEAVSIPDYARHDTGHGMVTATLSTFLHMAVQAGYNLVLIGATGSAKTTLINILGEMVPADRRVVVIEDTPEIRLSRGNFQRLVTRPPTLEGLPEITQRDLVKVALRQRPDALTIGEARGGEVFDLLKALWTGHRNGLTSIHAHSVEDMYQRIRMMLQESQLQTEVSEATVAQWVAKAFALAITLRVKGSRRWVEEVVELTGHVEAGQPVRNPLFQYDEHERRLKCTGYSLSEMHEAQLREHGLSYQTILNMARQRNEVLK